jgi:hypothetical protein
MSKKDDEPSLLDLKAFLKVGEYIIQAVENEAKLQAKEELKLKRSLTKFTGKKRD